MEDPAAFDLNQAITLWRERIKLQPSLGVDAVEELELHLLDAVRRFQAEGFTDEEAWNSALERLGNGTELEREFAKVNPANRTARVATSLLVSYIVFVVLISGWRFLNVGFQAGPVVVHLWPVAIPYTALNFLFIVLPLTSLFHLCKWAPPRWAALAIGITTSSTVGLLLSGATVSVEGLAGAVACGVCLAVFVRFKLTSRGSRLVSGAWMATGGAAFCGLISHLFGPHGFRISPDYASWLGLAMVPVLFGLSCCYVVAPLGAWLGVWLPERSRLAGPLRATVFGLMLGAGIASLLLLVQHLSNDLWMRSFGDALTQRHELQEFALRQTLAALATVVPSAALWTGLWTYRLALRGPVNHSFPTKYREFC